MTRSDQRKRELLERRIANLDERLATFAQQIASSRREGDRSRLEAERTLAERQLQTLVVELAGFRDEAPQLPDRLGASRLSLALVEERIGHLTRRAAAAERLEPSPAITEIVGLRPEDPVAAGNWNRAVDAFHRYRHRYGVGGSQRSMGLGPPPTESRQGADWRHAKREIDQARIALGLAADRLIERAM